MPSSSLIFFPFMGIFVEEFECFVDSRRFGGFRIKYFMFVIVIVIV